MRTRVLTLVVFFLCLILLQFGTGGLSRGAANGAGGSPAYAAGGAAARSADFIGLPGLPGPTKNPARRATATATPVPVPSADQHRRTHTPTRTPTNTPTRTPTRTPNPTGTPAATSTPVSATSTPAGTPPACGAPALVEGFESGTLGAFASSVATCVPGGCGWANVTTAAHGGTHAAFAPDVSGISDQKLTLSSAIAVPTAVTQGTLSFWHRYSFEAPNYDGGVLEVSTDSGGTWTDSGANIISGGYNGTLAASGQNPLAGRPAWVGNPNGTSFAQVVVDLRPYAGRSLLFRLREGTDLNTGSSGWWVDDFTVTVLSGACPTPTPLPSPVGDPVLVGAGDIADCGFAGDSQTAALLDGIPGTVMTLGDNAYFDGSPDAYANCYDPTWGRHKYRTRPAAGNHEYATPTAAGYFGYFGAAAGDPTKGYYSFDQGTWHVVVLNANCQYIGGCGAGSVQDQWLQADLAAHPATCTAALWHQARWGSGVHGSDPTYDQFWRDLYNAGADLVVNGHDHDYERFAPQNPSATFDPARGLREFVVGTGGGELEAGFSTIVANSEVRHDGTWGVLKLTLHPSSYDWQFIPVAGQGFTDSGTQACH